MSYDVIPLLIAGLTLGISAGITPGPLLALTISETLKYGTKTGFKVATVPLLTDTPIVLGSIFLLSELNDLNNVISYISIVGALFLFYFGIDNLRVKPNTASVESSKFSSIQKAIIANFLNPNPYLFWIAIGGPLFLGGLEIKLINGIVFMVSFYLMLVGSKMLIALISGKMKRIFESRKYLWAIRITGLMLIIFAILIMLDGIDKLNL